MNQILTGINDFMYTYILLILLVGAGVFFTVLSKGVKSFIERWTKIHYGKENRK